MHDFVIVGGGSAGCALAARLSELDDARVLLLESGPRDRDRNIHAPAGFHKVVGGPLTWGYDTAPLRQADGRRMIYPAGAGPRRRQLHQRHGLHPRQRRRL